MIVKINRKKMTRWTIMIHQKNKCKMDSLKLLKKLNGLQISFWKGQITMTTPSRGKRRKFGIRTNIRGKIKRMSWRWGFKMKHKKEGKKIKNKIRLKIMSKAVCKPYVVRPPTISYIHAAKNIEIHVLPRAGQHTDGRTRSPLGSY